MPSSPRILIVGSLNVDIVFRAPRLPAWGETMYASSMNIVPGGKGGNQATAVARLGASSTMVGKVGTDAFGAWRIEQLRAGGVNPENVKVTEQAPTGTAVIFVNDNADNCITIIGGANHIWDRADLDRILSLLKECQLLLLQLEIPIAFQALLAQGAFELGIPIVLDTGPPQPCPRDFVEKLTVISPNEFELGVLTGMPTTNEDEVYAAARALLELGPQHVVVKLGALGAYILSRGGASRYIPAFEIKPVDTTGAGDAFTAGLAVMLASGKNIFDAVRFANACGALATTKLGAQPSMPFREEVEKFLKDN